MGAFLTTVGGAAAVLSSVGATEFLKEGRLRSVMTQVQGAIQKRAAFAVPFLTICGLCWLVDSHSQFYDRHTRLLQTANAFNVLEDVTHSIYSGDAYTDEKENAYLKLRVETMHHSIGHIHEAFHKKAKYNVLMELVDEIGVDQNTRDKLKRFPPAFPFFLWYRLLPRDWEDTLKRALQLD